MSEKEKAKKHDTGKAEHKKEHTEHKKEAHSEHKPEHKAEHKKEAHEAAPKEKPVKEKKAPGERYVPRLKTLYKNEVVKKLAEEYKYKSAMAIPRLEKVVINIGVGKETIEKKDPGVVDSAQEELTLIAGQKAVKTYSKKAISNFHLRQGLAIGAKVNIRGNRMYDFVDKLISVALPRVRDFKGLSTSSFDGRGNYTIGLKEQLVFPEINYDKVKKVRGMDVTIVTSAKNDDESLKLLKALGFPFKDK